jgi:sulfate permease, SulP family
MTTTDTISAGNAVRAASARLSRAILGGCVATMMIVLDLIVFSQLIFSGPLAGSRTAGVAAMLSAYVLGGLVFAALKRDAVISLSFFGAAAIVQAAIAAPRSPGNCTRRA